MANHKQAEKRHRQSVARKARNSYYEATLKGLLKSARNAVASSAENAGETVKKAVSWIDHVAVKGVIPKNRASRLKSRIESALARN